jgi:hypothetical protein
MREFLRVVSWILLGMAVHSFLTPPTRCALSAGQETPKPSAKSEKPQALPDLSPIPSRVPRQQLGAKDYEQKPTGASALVLTKPPSWENKAQHLVMISDKAIRRRVEAGETLVIAHGKVKLTVKQDNQDVERTIYCYCVVPEGSNLPTAKYAYEHNLFQTTADSDNSYLRALAIFARDELKQD